MRKETETQYRIRIHLKDQGEEYIERKLMVIHRLCCVEQSFTSNSYDYYHRKVANDLSVGKTYRDVITDLTE